MHSEVPTDPEGRFPKEESEVNAQAAFKNALIEGLQSPASEVNDEDPESQTGKPPLTTRRILTGLENLRKMANPLSREAPGPITIEADPTVQSQEPPDEKIDADQAR